MRPVSCRDTITMGRGPAPACGFEFIMTAVEKCLGHGFGAFSVQHVYQDRDNFLLANGDEGIEGIGNASISQTA